MLGIGLHSFVDGIICSVTFNVSIFTGALVAIGMVLHEFPEGVVSFPFISKINLPSLGILLAVSAGALIYVGASHLLPAVEKENHSYTLISLGAGILVAVLIVLSKG